MPFTRLVSLFTLSKVLSLVHVTLPLIVASQQCGPLDNNPGKTIDLDSLDLVILTEITDTTQRHCYRACCSKIETDGCNTVVFDKITSNCTLVSCKNEGCLLISKDDSITTTIGKYDETTSTSKTTSLLPSPSYRTTTISTKQQLNSETTISSLVHAPVHTNNVTNEVTSKPTESISNTSSGESLDNQLITTEAIPTEESSLVVTDTTYIAPSSSTLEHERNSSKDSAITSTAKEQISVDNSSIFKDYTTTMPASPESQTNRTTTTIMGSANVTVISTSTSNSSSQLNETTIIVSTTQTPPISKISNQPLQNSTTSQVIHNTSLPIEVISSITSTSSNSYSSNISSVTTSYDSKVLNETTTKLINTSNVTPSHLNTSFASNVSEELTEKVALNVSTTPSDLFTVNKPTNISTSNQTSSTINTTTNSNHSADNMASPLNSTLFQPKTHHFISPDDQLPAILVAALSVGIIFIFVVFVLLGKRVFDSWQRRHYSRVDYLINGMYN